VVERKGHETEVALAEAEVEEAEEAEEEEEVAEEVVEGEDHDQQGWEASIFSQPEIAQLELKMRS